jgi:hypothetical protein
LGLRDKEWKGFLPVVDDLGVLNRLQNFARKAASTRKRRRSTKLPPSVLSRKASTAFPRTEVIWSPQLVESLRKTATRSDPREVLFDLRMRLEDVEAHRIRFVRRIEEHHIAVTSLRDAAQDFVDQIAVGIEHRETLAAFDVLENEVEEQGRFARAGSADHVAVLRPLFGVQGDRRRFPRMGVLAKDERMAVDDLRRGLGPGILALELRNADGRRRQMRQGNQFIGIEEHPGAVRRAGAHVRRVIPSSYPSFASAMSSLLVGLANCVSAAPRALAISHARALVPPCTATRRTTA